MGISGIGALVSGVGALGGLFGGGSDQPQAPQSWQAPQMDSTANNALGQIGNLGSSNIWQQILGQYGNVAQQGVNNPYAAGYQQNANQASQVGQSVGMGQIGAGQTSINSAQSLLPYAQQILQQSFDPQGQVYNQQQQQNTDQTRSALAARGILTSPFGAGVEDQSNLNFNNNWQNNLLSRMTQGAQGASSLTNSQIAGLNAGVGAQTAGLNTLGNAAALPYSTANTISGNQLGLLNQYGTAGQNAGTQSNMSIQDLLQYLGIGNQAGGVANQNYANQLAAQNNQFKQNQTLGANLGSAISGLGNTSFGKSIPTNWFG